MTEKIDNALNESRILVLGIQVLLGFQYQAVFQPGFGTIPVISRYVLLASLAFLLLCTALLMSPAAYDRIVEKGSLSWNFHEFMTRVTEYAIPPFAIALGLDLFIAGEKAAGHPSGLVLGLLGSLVALFFWVGLEAALASKQPKPQPKEQTMPAEPTSLKDKIKFVLTEVRVVLPGAQALLGFQFVVVFAQRFEKLPATLKYFHLASLGLIALATILLMAPAAYHRIVEDGEDTERLHSFASHMLLGAMTLLALGLTGDMLVVVQQVTHSIAATAASAALSLLLFFGLWFGYMWIRRKDQQAPGGTPVKAPQPHA